MTFRFAQRTTTRNQRRARRIVRCIVSAVPMTVKTVVKYYNEILKMELYFRTRDGVKTVLEIEIKAHGYCNIDLFQVAQGEWKKVDFAEMQEIGITAIKAKAIEIVARCM
jgi:hypothetical protein